MSFSRRFVRIFLFTVLACPGLYTLSCSGDDSSTDGDHAGDVVYVGDATDEALEAMLEGTPKNWNWKAGIFDAPAEGAILPKTPIPTFAWHQDTAHPEDGGTGTGMIHEPPRPWLDGLFGPERAAFAHGAPFNGTAFYLVFSTDQDDQILRVFTDATSYAPDEAAWGKLTAAKGTIKLEIMSAIFENNLLTSDGGPYDGSSVTFTISD